MLARIFPELGKLIGGLLNPPASPKPATAAKKTNAFLL
jgi:hypothetical protein